MLASFKRAMGKMTPAEAIARELAEAELALLSAHSGRDFADAMVSYNTKRVQRLKTTLSSLQTAASEAAA